MLKQRVGFRGGTGRFPPTGVCGSGDSDFSASRVRGRVAFEKRSENKQLKMAAMAAASPAPHRHRPELSAAAHPAGRHHLRRSEEGGKTGRGEGLHGCQRREERRAGAEGVSKLLKE